MRRILFLQIALLLTPCCANAGVTCNGKIYKNSRGNNTAEIRCAHDGSGSGTYKCTVSWKLRNVKGGEGTLSRDCGVVRGEKDKFCWSDEEVSDEKIKEAVDKPQVKCNPI